MQSVRRTQPNHRAWLPARPASWRYLPAQIHRRWACRRSVKTTHPTHQPNDCTPRLPVSPAAPRPSHYCPCHRAALADGKALRSLPVNPHRHHDQIPLSRIKPAIRSLRLHIRRKPAISIQTNRISHAAIRPRLPVCPTTPPACTIDVRLHFIPASIKARAGYLSTHPAISAQRPPVNRKPAITGKTRSSDTMPPSDAKAAMRNHAAIKSKYYGEQPRRRTARSQTAH